MKQTRRPAARSTPNRAQWWSLLAAAALLGGCDGCGRQNVKREDPSGRAAASAACPPGTEPQAGSVRAAAVAGSWYPGSHEELARTVDGYLSAAAPYGGAEPIALISPHAGYRFSGPTAAHGYRAVQGKRYERVYLLGPSHHTRLSAISVSPHAFFETPLGRVPVDRAVADALVGRPGFVANDADRQEHSLEIQLPMLQRALAGPFAVVPLLVGPLSREEVTRAAATLAPLVGARDLVVASSDFTHYGPDYQYVPFTEDVPARLEALGQQAYGAIAARDVDGFFRHRQSTGDTICGFVPIAIVLAMLPASAAAKLLRFETSGKLTGDYTSSVSYLSVAFTGPRFAGQPPTAAAPPGCVPGGSRPVLGETARRNAHTLARGALERWVREHRRLDPAAEAIVTGPELDQERGVFVTLKKHGRLRGCIGNIWPQGPLSRAIVDGAIAASEDDRFTPVVPDELAAIDIEITVLGPTRPIAGQHEIVLGRDGVVLHHGGAMAVFLPQVAPEQGWTVDQTLSELSLKAGLAADAYRDASTRLEVFEGLVF